MRISFKQSDVTPKRPCWQGGYVQRKTFYENVHDPINSTTLCLSINDKKIVWINIDVAGVNQELQDTIIKKCHDNGVDVDVDSFVLSATHTHSGPLLGDHFDRTADKEYVDFVIDTLVDYIKTVFTSEGTEVRVKYRSTLIDGLYSNRNDKNKLSDKIVHELGFFDNDERLVLILCTLAHHCTILGPNFMDCSADLFGELRRQISAKENVPVFMAQGNAGDMGNKQYRQSNLYDEVLKQATNITDQMNKKHSEWQSLQVNSFNIRSGKYKAIYDVDVNEFIVKKADFEEKLKTETNFDTVKLLVTGIKSFERKIAKGSSHVERDMPYRIADMDDLQIVFVPGELVSILGLRIKEASKAKVCLLWGYVAPGNLGYMIEKEAYEGFSQESNVTDYPAGIPDEYAANIIENL